jgi:hypothetical protein
MPRRSNSLPVSPSDVTRILPSPIMRQEQADRLLTQAHQLLAKVAEESYALEQCLVVLKESPTEACFFYQADPPLLVAAVGRKAGACTGATLYARLTTTLQQIPTRIESICLNTLFTLHRLGVPVALWHFLIPGPLPTTVAALAPTSIRGLAPTGHSPPTSDLYAPSLFVSPLD